MKTAVVILNWNGKNLLERFLPALTASLDSDSQLIIADNNSQDDSLSFLAEKYPQLRIIRNTVNEGFASGYNTALSQVDAEYFCLLNSDVDVTPGWLKPLTDYLDKNPGVAVVQPKLLWEKDRTVFEYGGAAGGYIDMLGYPFCRGRIFGSLETDHGQYEDAVPVFWASGACMVIRSNVFREVGGFDPAFFAHMEEIDLCWRIRNQGHEIVCLPSSTVFHVGGATLPKNNPGKTYLNFRNNLSMLFKNLPYGKLVPVLFARLLMDGLAGIHFLTEGHWRDCIAVIRAHWAFYFRVISGKIKRKPAPVPERHRTIYNGLIVWDHYFMRKKTFNQLKFKPGKLL